MPSHGTDLLGARYAIDFVGVDEHRRTASVRDWRTLLASEPVRRFVAFGRPVLSPVAGTVVRVHDGEADHAGRRSQLALVPYALGQGARFRAGAGAMAGNHVVIATAGESRFVVLAHLRAGSLGVVVGQDVVAGQQVAECGNSGNSTQPHVHLQVMDGLDPYVARGVPMVFGRFQEWRGGAREPRLREAALPDEGSVVEPAAGDAGADG